MSSSIENRKVSHRLPPRPRLSYDGMLLIPVTDCSGFVVEGMWHVPGGDIRSTEELRRLGSRRGLRVRIIANP